MTRLRIITVIAGLLAVPALAKDNAPPDGWLTAKAKLTLITNSELKSNQVHVDSNEGLVTLYGKVEDAAQRMRAEKAVREIKGVRGVRNLLQIVPGSQERAIARSDGDIKDQAEKMLKEDTALKGSDISVKSVDKGVVLVDGKARTFSDQLRAVDDIDQIAGVRKVVSQIKGPETYGYEERNLTFDKEKAAPAERSSVSDTRVTTAVKLRLLGASEVPSMDINVDTQDGVVTLFGVVPNQLAKDKAELETSHVSGVTRVQNQLEVVPKSQQKEVAAKDEEIMSHLKDRLGGNPDYKDIKADVKAGVVRLTGNVGSAWEKLDVMRVARTTQGVRGLEEQIEITPREKPEGRRQF